MQNLGHRKEKFAVLFLYYLIEQKQHIMELIISITIGQTTKGEYK